MRPIFFGPAIVLLAMAGSASPALAQGAGSTGASVLQLLAGSRAASLSGAYVAATSDADVVFYNPAGLARLGAAAGLSYQRHVEDISVASGSGALRVAGFTIGIGGAFLDAGSIPVIEPDPNFGGQTGRPTGANVSASEAAGRLAVARALMDARLHLGAAAGFAATSIAERSQTAVLFDIGAQWYDPRFTLGAAARNLGGGLSGDDLATADLPSELRGGIMAPLPIGGDAGITVSADLVHRLHESTTGAAFGVEAGLVPTPGPQPRFGAVARIGYNAVDRDGAIGAVQFGGGLTYGAFALDYVFQNYDFFGAVHRFGVRWHGR